MWHHSQHTYLDEPFTQSSEGAAEDRLKGLRHGEESWTWPPPYLPLPSDLTHVTAPPSRLSHLTTVHSRGSRCFMSTTELIWLLLAWVEKGAEPEAILSLVVRILRVRHARSTFPLQGASILPLWQELSSLSSQAHRQKHLESCLKDHRAGHHKGEKKGRPTPCMLISKGPRCSLTGRLMVIEGK